MNSVVGSPTDNSALQSAFYQPIENWVRMNPGHGWAMLTGVSTDFVSPRASRSRQSFYGDSDTLSIDAAVFILRRDGYDVVSGRQWPEKMPECVPVEQSGRSLSVDHYNSSGIGRSRNFNNVSVLNQRSNTKSWYSGGGRRESADSLSFSSGCGRLRSPRANSRRVFHRVQHESDGQEAGTYCDCTRPVARDCSGA